MLAKTCLLLSVLALPGCISPSGSAPPALDVDSGAVLVGDLDGGPVGDLDGDPPAATRDGEERAKPRPPRASRPAPKPLLKRVASASSDATPLGSAPVEAADGQSDFSREMDEQYRRSDGAAHRAIRSMCSGC